MATLAGRYIAIDNVCAWPNLTLLSGGEIIASIFNQPSHGKLEGDVECWQSKDGGRTWRYQSTPAPHQPRRNRMNVAAGLADNGDLLVLTSGWNLEVAPTCDSASGLETPILARSPDGGQSWHLHSGLLPTAPTGYSELIPFGDVVCGTGGLLAVSAYALHLDTDESTCWFLRSFDDGQSWQEPIILAANDHNETAIMHLEKGQWLAAARTAKSRNLEQHRSDDNGATWRFDQHLSAPGQHPAHYLRLQDGRILLTYGVRNAGCCGVNYRLSSDAGSWGEPVTLIQFPLCDSGYPSTVQNADGTLVTAYYAGGIPEHQRYHMGVALWNLDD